MIVAGAHTAIAFALASLSLLDLRRMGGKEPNCDDIEESAKFLTWPLTLFLIVATAPFKLALGFVVDTTRPEPVGRKSPSQCKSTPEVKPTGLEEILDR